MTERLGDRKMDDEGFQNSKAPPWTEAAALGLKRWFGEWGNEIEGPKDLHWGDLWAFLRFGRRRNGFDGLNGPRGRTARRRNTRPYSSFCANEGNGRMRSVGDGVAYRRRDGSAPRGRRLSAGSYSSFCAKQSISSRGLPGQLGGTGPFSSFHGESRALKRKTEHGKPKTTAFLPRILVSTT